MVEDLEKVYKMIIMIFMSLAMSSLVSDSPKGRVYGTSLIPRSPGKVEKRIWCFEQHFLARGMGPTCMCQQCHKIVPSLIPRPHPACISLPSIMHRTESNPRWGWFWVWVQD